MKEIIKKLEKRQKELSEDEQRLIDWAGNNQFKLEAAREDARKISRELDVIGIILFALKR